VASTEEAIERTAGLDFAVVANANEAHVPTARAALEAGLPVVADKPLAPSAGEAREVVGEAERRGVLLTVFFNRRWDSDQLEIARLLETGNLGRVLRHESRFGARR
jgi:predicted dehydrogenase